MNKVIWYRSWRKCLFWRDFFIVFKNRQKVIQNRLIKCLKSVGLNRIGLANGRKDEKKVAPEGLPEGVGRVPEALKQGFSKIEIDQKRWNFNIEILPSGGAFFSNYSVERCVDICSVLISVSRRGISVGTNIVKKCCELARTWVNFDVGIMRLRGFSR